VSIYLFLVQSPLNQTAFLSRVVIGKLWNVLVSLQLQLDPPLSHLELHRHAITCCRHAVSIAVADVTADVITEVMTDVIAGVVTDVRTVVIARLC